MRKYVRFYFTDAEKYEDLTDEELGMLLRAGIKYADAGEVPEFKDKLLKFAWKELKVSIDIDINSYDKKLLNSTKGGINRAIKERLNLDDEQFSNLKKTCTNSGADFNDYAKYLNGKLNESSRQFVGNTGVDFATLELDRFIRQCA